MLRDKNTKINIKQDRVSTSNFSVEHLFSIYEREIPKFTWTDNKVMGFPLPTFQRQKRWTEEQSVSFIESIWRGYDIGSYMLVAVEYGKPFSGGVIDGQQRLFAIEQYINDKFKVLGYYWSELTHRDKMRFENVPFPCRYLHVHDEQKLKDTYNRLNFSGVQHTESEKA